MFILGAALGLAGCASAGPYRFGPDGPLPCERAACAVDLGNYRSIQDREGQDSALVMAVAISGGGHRSANFATGVLLGLEQIAYGSARLLGEIDYLSTVSGGGFAASAYLTALLEHQRAGTGDFSYAEWFIANCGVGARDEDRCRAHSLTRSYEGLFAWVRHPEIIFTSVTGGDLLERDIDTRLLSTWTLGEDGRLVRRSTTLRDVFVPRDSARRPTLPYWVANAALYRNGAIFPFTPDVLRRYQVSRYRHRLDRDTLADPYDMPLAVGAKASVSVPGLIPLTTLESHPRRRFRYLRLLDGGVADNLGVLTAADLLCQDTLRMTSANSAGSSRRRFMLVIDAYQEDGMPYDASPRSSALGNIIRAAVVGLDSWRGRYAGVMRTFGARCGFDMVALDFWALDSLGANPWSGTAAEREACVNEIAPSIPRDGESVEQALARLKRDAQGVRTRFRITGDQQDVLLTAGKLVTCFARSAIRSAVGPAP
ncbi:MAG TPA: patatin-like phospholipase family protein [Gemmatimonadaceae bacterium]|nr:patatin-like phospholipase family protein [Gemmatimonadaceae bacterium]